MDNQEGSEKKKIVLEVGLQDLINIASKSNEAPFTQQAIQHNVDGEELKKAWFNYVLLSIEKLHDSLEKVRREDLMELKKELREEIRRIEDKVTKLDDGLELYKKEVVEPLNVKSIVLTTKLAIWGILAGVVGSGFGSILLWLLKEILIKASIISPAT